MCCPSRCGFNCCCYAAFMSGPGGKRLVPGVQLLLYHLEGESTGLACYLRRCTTCKHSPQCAKPWLPSWHECNVVCRILFKLALCKPHRYDQRKLCSAAYRILKCGSLDMAGGPVSTPASQHRITPLRAGTAG